MTTEENMEDMEDRKMEHQEGSSDQENGVLTNLENQMVDLEERRRQDCLGNLAKIEKEFADLKEKFFNEKIEALRKETEAIKSGTHQGFLKKCKELEEIKNHKIWSAEKWREYQLQNVENIFEAEKRQALDEFKADKKSLREKMLQSSDDKKKKLIDEKSTMNLIDGAEKVKRNLRKRGLQKEQKDQTSYKRRLHPPHVNYSLKESEINEDLSLILKQSSSNFTLGKDRTKIPEVYTDKGKLIFHNQTFEKGREISIEAKHENGKWQGVLVGINPLEIYIRSIDGTKSRFTISQIRNGKFGLSYVN